MKHRNVVVAPTLIRLGSLAGTRRFRDAGVPAAYDHCYAGGHRGVVDARVTSAGGVGDVLRAKGLVDDLNAVLDRVLDRLDKAGLSGVVVFTEDLQCQHACARSGAHDLDPAPAGGQAGCL